MIGNLLINEPPLQVLPTLAKQIGLNEAIVTQQVHYWLLRSKNKRDGITWVYKTYIEWQEEFPFWSESTIKRTITSLEKQKILISTSKYNKMPMDRTKWYSINYSALQPQPLGQNDTMQQVNMTSASVQNDTMQGVKMTSAITREYTETTPENTTENNMPGKPAALPYESIVNYLNQKANTKYRHTSKNTQKLIKARFNDGFTEQDFYTVIDKKVVTWLNDNKMSQYLRPETLFGTKFESYLNEHVKTPRNDYMKETYGDLPF